MLDPLGSRPAVINARGDAVSVTTIQRIAMSVKFEEEGS